jgi:hypothetical protein
MEVDGTGRINKTRRKSYLNHRFPKGVVKMKKFEKITGLVLKAVAVGMSTASIVMGFIPDAVDVDTHITLLGIGLAALAIAALMKED